MTDDIVTRLRTVDRWSDVIGITTEAADEIERLRAAGDALAQSHERALAALGIDWNGRQQSLRAWQEARRG